MLKTLGLLGASLLLAACTSVVSVQVPSAANIPAFQTCIANPSVTYQAPAQGDASRAEPLATSLYAYEAGAPAGPQPISTAPPPAVLAVLSVKTASTHTDPLAVEHLGHQRLEAARRVASILANRPVHEGVLRLYNELSAASPPGEIDLSAEAIRTYGNAVYQSTSLGDWTAYRNVSIVALASALRQAHATPTLSSKEAVRENLRNTVTAIYIDAYITAYFRDGQFARGTLSLEGLLAEFPQLANLPAPLQAQLQAIVNQAQSDATFGKIGDTALVTRGGDKLQVPSITVSFDPAKGQLSATKVDYALVGSDLIRVLFEAIFDANDRVPAVSTATGVGDPAAKTNIPGAVRLVDFGKITGWNPPYSAIDADKFGQIQSFANSASSTTATATGQAIRGLGPASLNNEAVAKLIESLVGTVSRKVAEKVAWCWFADLPPAGSNDHEVLPSELAPWLEPDDGPGSADSVRRVNVRVSFMR